VDFFFALSGFVMARRYDGQVTDEGSAVRYLIVRIGRIWPLHVLMLAIFVAVSAGQGDIGTEHNSVESIWTNLALVQAWGIHHTTTWNQPSWSISVEFALYLMFLAMAWVPRRAPVYLALSGAGFLVISTIAPQGIASSWDFAVFRGMAGFFLGCLVARVPLRAFGTVTELLTIAAVVSFVMYAADKTLAPAIFAVAVYVFAGSTGAVNGLLNRPAAVKLGEWSFAIYMVHMLFVAALWVVGMKIGLGVHADGRHMTGLGVFPSIVAAVVYLLGITAVGGVVHERLDAPVQRWVKSFAKGVSVRSPPVAP
jgi:peptidoglycan/LPS O-acetylase OafA/YrhL